MAACPRQTDVLINCMKKHPQFYYLYDYDDT